MNSGPGGVEGAMTLTSGPPVTSSSPSHAGFVALYERELDRQVRRAALLVGDTDVAHDLVHDAFVEVYRRWADVREPGPYLSTSVLNRCRDQGRRASTRERRLPLLAQRGDADDELLWDALGHLPFNHRAALVLRYYHQLPEREIASLLGCRPGSVGPWIQRGLKALRKELS
jgi:RNA polymerase sigma factor (sigma-70 family)